MTCRRERLQPVGSGALTHVGTSRWDARASVGAPLHPASAARARRSTTGPGPAGSTADSPPLRRTSPPMRRTPREALAGHRGVAFAIERFSVLSRRSSDALSSLRPPGLDSTSSVGPEGPPDSIGSLQPTSLPEGTGRPAASASTSRPPPARAAAVRPSVAVPPPPRRRRHVHLGVRSATSEEVTARPPGVRTTTSEEVAARAPQRRDTSTGEVPLAPGRPSAPPREPMPYPGARPPLRATVRPHDPAASGRAPVAPGAVALRVLATCLAARSPGGDIPRRGCRSPPRAIARSPVAATDRLVLHLRHGVLHRLRDGRSRSRSARSRPASDTLRLAGGACPEAIATHRQVTGCPPFIPSLSPGNALQCAHHRHSARVVDGAVASGRGPPCALWTVLLREVVAHRARERDTDVDVRSSIAAAGDSRSCTGGPTCSNASRS